MPLVNHISSSRKIDPNTEILIIGTFNPNTPKNPADFFYGRRQNFLWRLLPLALGENDLKKSTREEKISFIQKHKIDFTDLIDALEVEDGMEYVSKIKIVYCLTATLPN